MDFWDIFWPQFWQGVGMSMFFLPLTQITLSRIAPENIANASSLSNFIRILAGGIGTSIATTLWERREAVHHAHLVESINPYNPMSVEMQQQMGQMGINVAQQHAVLNQTITQQAYIMASNEVFYAGAILFIVLIGVVWFAKPPFGASGGGGGAH
jgi:DHA2 family multidrug resistance protein